MKEVRQHSDKTVTLAARRVRAALCCIPHPDLRQRDRLDMLVCQLIRQGLEPHDIAGTNGATAVRMIASVLPRDAEIDAIPGGMSSHARKPGWIVVDSYIDTIEVAPGKTIKLPVPKHVRTSREPSAAWQRVIDRVLLMPEKQKP